MISPEELVGGEWAAWYRLSPLERWRESEKLWQSVIAAALVEEEKLEREADRQYWKPLKRELESLRHARASQAKH